MRIGLLGGSFDPPHVGHLLTASDAVEALGLDRLVLVPAATQPLKQGQAQATEEQRLAMVRLLVQSDQRLEVDPVEMERGGLSFTVDTLAAYAARHPGAELVFLVGADVLQSFSRWREPERIRALATIAVMQRGGEPAVMEKGMIAVDTRRVDVSSSEIRARVRDGLPVRGFVTDAVGDYITAERLYR
ncbi:MAG: nicotinate (nicotinamide) nucleotide adenylyltransferase [Gemmatimonadaceae bacterium]|nr:nicotinate (nicotinamide) nucleotide adenylyltransferase [Gemmatimonadaceae bacterium]